MCPQRTSAPAGVRPKHDPKHKQGVSKTKEAEGFSDQLAKPSSLPVELGQGLGPGPEAGGGGLGPRALFSPKKCNRSRQADCRPLFTKTKPLRGPDRPGASNAPCCFTRNVISQGKLAAGPLFFKRKQSHCEAQASPGKPRALVSHKKCHKSRQAGRKPLFLQKQSH